MEKIELSLVIPGYNEDSVIENTLRRSHQFLQDIGISFELIFVNDGSTDATPLIVENLRDELPNLRLVSYSPNRGRGFAIRQGIEHSRGQYVMTMESDLNFGLKVIQELYERIKLNKEEVVLASPYVKGGRTANIPFTRAFLSKWGNKVLALSTSYPLHCLSGMTRMYNGQVIRELALYSDDKEIHLEILSKLISLGCRIIEIPATLAWPSKSEQKELKWSSKFPASKYIKSHLLFTFMERPLLFFGLLGLALLIAGIGIGVYIVYLRFAGALNPIRPLMTLVVLLVLGGFLSIAFGLLGLQISDIRKDIYRMQNEFKQLSKKKI